MTSGNEQVIRDFFELWGKGEIVPACEQYLTDDARWLNSGLPECVGKSACMTLAARVAKGFPIIEVDIVSLAVNGDVVLAERVDRLTPQDGSAKLDVEMIGSFRLRDGKIHYWYDYHDPRAMGG